MLIDEPLLREKGSGTVDENEVGCIFVSVRPLQRLNKTDRINT